MKTLSFKEKVFAVVRRIPPGKLMTYGEVAAQIGSPKFARAVGGALRTNYDPEIPCHRVVSSSGTLTGYNRGLKKKAQLLKKEGALKALEEIRLKAVKSSRNKRSL